MSLESEGGMRGRKYEKSEIKFIDFTVSVKQERKEEMLQRVLKHCAMNLINLNFCEAEKPNGKLKGRSTYLLHIRSTMLLWQFFT